MHLSAFVVIAQEGNKTLTFKEYLGYVDAFHPIARQAAIYELSAREKLREARGGFDPELYHYSDKKEFDDKFYFFHSTTGLKVPLWYGVELNAQYDLANGALLNPENDVPNQGLNTVGIKVSVLQGLFTNQRMADVQQAKVLMNLAKAERQKQVLKLFQKATLAYWEWSAAAEIAGVYNTSYQLAQEQFQNTKKLFEQGAKSAFDTLETFTQMQNRLNLLLEYQAKSIEKRNKAANYLWTEEQEPVQIPEGITPETIVGYAYVSSGVDSITSIIDNLREANPELRRLTYKIQEVEVKQKLQTQYLIPKLELKYNILNEGFALSGETFQADYFTNNYKWGINFSYPLLIRDARGARNQSILKVESLTLEKDQRYLEITNEINALLQNFVLVSDQITLGADLIENFRRLFEGERTRFFNGESDFFIVNRRELSYLSYQAKLMDLHVRQIEIGTELDVNLGIIPGK